LRNPKRGVNLFSYLTEFGECLAFSPTEFSTVIPAKHPHKFKNKSLPTDSFWPSRTDYFPGTACKALTENKIRPAHTQTHSHLPHTHTHTHAHLRRGWNPFSWEVCNIWVLFFIIPVLSAMLLI